MTPGVFVDTSAFVALIRRNDEHHQNALIIAERLKQQRIRLYTTNFVIAETHAGVRQHDVNLRAFIHLALSPEPAPVQLDQTACHSQPQTPYFRADPSRKLAARQRRYR